MGRLTLRSTALGSHARSIYSYGLRGTGGDVIVLDLESLNLTTGKIDPPVKATTGGDTTVKFPQTVTATWDKDRFLVASPNDVNRGLGALTLKRDDSGKVTSAALVSIEMPQPFNAVRIDRLNIQRAQSAVLVEQGGIEYAIVSDDNHPFEDAFVQAMFEAPMFVSLGGPPIPFGGSASAKKVAAGGKLGIVQDPFGKLGAPKYLGATLPLDGYGIINLSLSEDGKVLIGQLIGGFSVNFEDSQQKPHQNHAWSVPELITAALTNPQPLSKHIKLTANAEQLIPIATSTADYTAAPAGTAFDPDDVELSVTGRIGDVMEIDLKRLTAHKLLKLPAPSDTLTVAEKALIAAKESQIKLLMDGMSTFGFKLGVKDRFVGEESSFTLVNEADGNVLSRTSALESATFAKEGRFYVVPHLTAADITNLRDGKALATGKQGTGITLVYDLANDVGDIKKGPGSIKLTLSANDYDTKSNMFFGDRPLDNPGYSALKLKSATGQPAEATTKATDAIDRLDIIKIEQRLKYLGYGVSAIKGNGEITVDGKFDAAEKIVLRQFHEIVEGDTGYTDTTINQKTKKPTTTPLPAYKFSISDINWLNAYNAPHWMQYSTALGKTLTGWVDKSNASMATSWVFDLMKASQKSAENQSPKRSTAMWFAGAGTLGTQLKLGINTDYISQANQDKVNGKDVVLGKIPLLAEGNIPNFAAFNSKQWNLTNAAYLAAKLKNPNIDNTGGTSPANTAGVNQQDQALLDFFTVFATTQKVGNVPSNPNGYWNGIQIANSNADVIRTALFGSGTQTTGLIDSSKIIIGGDGTPLGSAMTAESLRALMANAAPASYYADWVRPLQEAMQEFSINTPQRIAAFLAQVRQETGGMTALVENLRYPASLAASTFGVFGGSVESVRQFYEVELGLTAIDATRERYRGWTDALNVEMAEKVYGHTTAKGQELGNTIAGDGGRFLGYGLKQLTGRSNLTRFANYLGELARGQVLADPLGTIGTDKALAARSAAWFWSTNYAKSKIAGRWVTDGLLNDKASTILWINNAVQPNQQVEFNKISGGVGNAAHPLRWVNYQDVVSKVLTGGNPYENLHASLTKLGFKSQAGLNNTDKFSFAVRPSSAPLPISRSSNLLAQERSAVVVDAGAEQAVWLTSAEESMLLSQAGYVFDQLMQSPLEQQAMWMPNLNQAMTVAVLGLTTSLPAYGATDKFALGICQTARPNLAAFIAPADSGGSFLYQYLQNHPKFDEWTKSDFSQGTKVDLLVPPKHGTLTYLEDRLAVQNNKYQYFPKPGFESTDHFVMQVEKSGFKVKIYYVIKALDNVEADVGFCPKEFWRISQSGQPEISNGDYAAWQRSADLSAVVANASQSLTGFFDLASTALGETTGEGLTAQITLDTNAAGHNWYIDPTPLDNSDDYLPTSDPTVFRARAGSAAEGKMDMLSVLLHEYGHALGLEHSGNGADFMAASLQPGVRKLPSSEELALMARLVAELRGAEGRALTLALSQGEREQDNPFAPSPLSALGLLPFGFMRRNGGNGSANAAVATGAATAVHTDYLTAINTTLANGSFSTRQNGTIDQWESVGNVTTAPAAASQAVTLGESTTAQAHLGQAFVLSAQDRFLTFTVSGLNLQSNSIEQNGVFTAASQDAFEVALQNANTGANLLANGPGSVGNYPF